VIYPIFEEGTQLGGKNDKTKRKTKKKEQKIRKKKQKTKCNKKRNIYK